MLLGKGQHIIRALQPRALQHRHLDPKKLLQIHAEAFTHRLLYTQTPLHTDSFTHRCFYTQTTLHTDAFTHRGFYTQRLLHTEAFTHRSFYTQRLLHADTFTQTLLPHRHFYTQTLLHTGAFTHRRLHGDFYTQTLTRRLLHTDAHKARHHSMLCDFAVFYESTQKMAVKRRGSEVLTLVRAQRWTHSSNLIYFKTKHIYQKPRQVPKLAQELPQKLQIARSCIVHSYQAEIVCHRVGSRTHVEQHFPPFEHCWSH